MGNDVEAMEPGDDVVEMELNDTSDDTADVKRQNNNNKSNGPRQPDAGTDDFDWFLEQDQMSVELPGQTGLGGGKLRKKNKRKRYTKKKYTKKKYTKKKYTRKKYTQQRKKNTKKKY
jgi:hypothetical protein